jgi:hypothetical protein
MKKTFILFAIFFSMSFLSANAQSDLGTQLRNLHLGNYLRKPIDSLIPHLPAGYDTAFGVGSSGNVNHGACLLIYYPNNEYWISIDIYDPQYITVQRPNRFTHDEEIWPVALLRKEKIRGVEILNRDYQVINEAWVY